MNPAGVAPGTWVAVGSLGVCAVHQGIPANLRAPPRRLIRGSGRERAPHRAASIAAARQSRSWTCRRPTNRTNGYRSPSARTRPDEIPSRSVPRVAAVGAAHVIIGDGLTATRRCQPVLWGENCVFGTGKKNEICSFNTENSDIIF